MSTSGRSCSYAMQSVFHKIFHVLFFCLFIDRTQVNAATLWPGLFAQTVLRTPPLFWPPAPYQHHNLPSDDLITANLQQSESHLLGSAEHHLISSDPIPSGLFIPVDQLHRELFNSPHLLRKHSSNQYPSYQQFNHFHPHHQNKKILNNKHKTSSKFKSFNKHFLNRKKQQPKDDFINSNNNNHNDRFNYLNDEFYAKNSDLFNFNKFSGHLLSEYVDYNVPPQAELEMKQWKHSNNKQTEIDQDRTNTLINTTEEQANQEEDDLFTIKNNLNEQAALRQQQQHPSKHNNGRIDLRKSNKKKLLNDHLKELKELREYRDSKEVKDYKDMQELKEMREQKQSNENRYIENYDNRSNQNNPLSINEPSTNDNRENYNENRNIERYNLAQFFKNDKLAQELIRNDGRILINTPATANRNEKSVYNNFKNSNGELSVISETIYQNHQNDNRRSPSRLVLMQNYDHPPQFEQSDGENNGHNNESITILTNKLSSNKNETDDNQTLDQSQTKNDQIIKLASSIQQNKLDQHSEEQQPPQQQQGSNQQLFVPTTFHAQRIIPTPQISFMQTVFTEANTTPTNDQSTKPTTYLSERSQLNQNNNHFSTFAISAIIVASLIAALLFTGSSLFLMYKVSQIKKRRLMRFQETANRNQFQAVFPVETTSCKTTTSGPRASNTSLEPNTLSNSIISNNNFIRQQKSLFSNLNSRCNAGKSMLSIKEQIDPNFTIKPSKTATINKKAGKHLNVTGVGGGSETCFVTQIKTSSNEKNSALSRLISKMTNQSDEASSSRNDETDQPHPNQTQNIQRVSFF